MRGTLCGTVLRHLRQPGAPVTVSAPSGTEVRSGPGGTGGKAGGVDSEVVGPVPVPVMSGSTWARRVRAGDVLDSWASTLSGP
jgi:hypothetical protein